MESKKDRVRKDIEGLMADFERLEKNRANVPLKVLETTYREPYRKLKERIASEARTYVAALGAEGVGRLGDDYPEHREAFADGVTRIIREAEERGLMRRLGRALFRDLDLQEFEAIVIREVMLPVRYEVYAPYWLEHCICRPDGSIINDLTGAVWLSVSQTWVKRNGDGTFRIFLNLPPTKELIEAEYAMRKKGETDV